MRPLFIASLFCLIGCGSTPPEPARPLSLEASGLETIVHTDDGTTCQIQATHVIMTPNGQHLHLRDGVRATTQDWSLKTASAHYSPTAQELLLPEQLVCTHPQGWLRASSGTYQAKKNLVSLTGPIESIIRIATPHDRQRPPSPSLPPLQTPAEPTLAPSPRS